MWLYAQGVMLQSGFEGTAEGGLMTAIVLCHAAQLVD